MGTGGYLAAVVTRQHEQCGGGANDDGRDRGEPRTFDGVNSTVKADPGEPSRIDCISPSRDMKGPHP